MVPFTRRPRESPRGAHRAPQLPGYDPTPHRDGRGQPGKADDPSVTLPEDVGALLARSAALGLDRRLAAGALRLADRPLVVGTVAGQLYALTRLRADAPWNGARPSPGRSSTTSFTREREGTMPASSTCAHVAAVFSSLASPRTSMPRNSRRPSWAHSSSARSKTAPSWTSAAARWISPARSASVWPTRAC